MAAEDEELSSEANTPSEADAPPDSEYEMMFCDNGWVEIRNPDDADAQWLMADTSAEIRQ